MNRWIACLVLRFTAWRGGYIGGYAQGIDDVRAFIRAHQDDKEMADQAGGYVSPLAARLWSELPRPDLPPCAYTLGWTRAVSDYAKCLVEVSGSRSA